MCDLTEAVPPMGTGCVTYRGTFYQWLSTFFQWWNSPCYHRMPSNAPLGIEHVSFVVINHVGMTAMTPPLHFCSHLARGNFSPYFKGVSARGVVRDKVDKKFSNYIPSALAPFHLSHLGWQNLPRPTAIPKFRFLLKTWAFWDNNAQYDILDIDYYP